MQWPGYSADRISSAKILTRPCWDYFFLVLALHSAAFFRDHLALFRKTRQVLSSAFPAFKPNCSIVLLGSPVVVFRRRFRLFSPLCCTRLSAIPHSRLFFLLHTFHPVVRAPKTGSSSQSANWKSLIGEKVGGTPPQIGLSASSS
jgi:hypothetical protein